MAEWIIYITEILGTVAFSASGAMIGIQRRLDLFGIVFLSVITSFGGGIVRDIVLGHFPPRMFFNFELLALAVLVSVAVFILTYANKVKVEKQRETFEWITNVIDAVGLAAFSIAGVEITVASGYSDNMVLCILMGMTTGVGGGILRDMMTRSIPYVLKKHIYALASLSGSLLFYLLIRFGTNNTVAMLVAIGFIVTVRILAARYKWSLPKIHSSKEKEEDYE